jgi:hypothetical protein
LLARGFIRDTSRKKRVPVRPNDSALHPLHFSKLPLGALIVNGLLLGFCVSSVTAQTRLDSNQVAR